jgi:hypothetical protein
MPSRVATRTSRSRPRRKHARRIRRGSLRGLRAVRRLARSVRRLTRGGRRALRGAPRPVRIVAVIAIAVGVWAAVNWSYHAIRKPSELFFPVSGVLAKDPEETWQEYGPLFEEHATRVITPQLLAALAQVEAAGNPLARTYWRWRPARNPFSVYAPASSAVGMYQMTDETFREARSWCIHDHVATESCWFNALYSRVVPSHSIEMTSANLDRRVAEVLSRRRVVGVTPKRQQDLAALMHLCGPGAGDVYVRHGFRLSPRQRCGDHDVAAYLGRVEAMKRRFDRLVAAAGQQIGDSVRPATRGEEAVAGPDLLGSQVGIAHVALSTDVLSWMQFGLAVMRAATWMPPAGQEHTLLPKT